ncbi:MAG: hypothetical protein GY847_42010 [Proteobacteria bacterium]|nr:hypothetical protein [Pseudomonadota bacterium]
MSSRKPDKTIGLVFEHARPSYELECQQIVTNEMPDSGGVYIVRYAEKTISRVKGKSSILKIGQSKNFVNRFNNYNGKRSATAACYKKLSDLRDVVEKAWTEWHLMWLTYHESKKNKLVIDFYIDSNPQELERARIMGVLDEHLELPPLNLNLGKW